MASSHKISNDKALEETKGGERIKKILSEIVICAVCLFAAIVTVNAGTRWYVGDQFDANGKSYTETYSKTGNFSNGLNFVGKYTEAAMTIQLKGEKKGFIFWSDVAAYNVNVQEGAGDIIFNPNPVNRTYNASGTNNVRVSWTQKTSGHLAAFRLYS